MKLPILARYIYYIVIFLAFLGLGLNLFFLYNDFYKTMAQSEIVYILRSQVSFEVVNISLWNNIENKIKYKKSPALAEDDELNNPFIDILEE